MNLLAGTWVAALLLALAVHGSQANGLDPNGTNVCSKVDSVLTVDGEVCGDCSLAYPSQFDYYCCPGWSQTGRDCTLRHPCPNGKENCTEFHTGILPKPTLTYSKNFAASNMEMVCSFDFPKWKNVSYKVEWFTRSTTPAKTDTWCVPGRPMSGQNDCKRRSSSIFSPSDFKLGDTVWCRLFMKFSTKKTNEWTRIAEESNKHYIGIEVSRRDVTVKECNVAENITVTLRPTVPILPTVGVPGSDSVDVYVLIPKRYKVQRRQAAVDKCNVKLKTEDITRGQTITIRGVCDNQRDETRPFYFRFKPKSSSLSWQGVENYRMLSTKIAVRNTETKPCLSTSDPHLYTFDDSYLFYNDLGDYLMHQNEDTKVEVQVRLWECSAGVNCVCGAAIREGKHVIEISMCNKKDQVGPTVLRTIKRSSGKLPRGIEVTRSINGQSLDQEVTLLSGTRISVHRSGKSLDVRVNAPASQENKAAVSGLCGNFNGNKADDFWQWRDGKIVNKDKNAFIKNWRLTPDKSLFEISIEEEIEEGKEEESKSCYCGVEGELNQIPKCEYNANLFAKIESSSTEVITTQINDQSNFGKKRSVDGHWYSDDIIDYEDRSYFVDDPQVQHAMNRIRSKRSLRVVMSKHEAHKYCRKYIEESEAARSCKGISKKSIRDAIKQCSKDLQLTGDKTFAVLSFESMKYLCEDTALKSLSSYTFTARGDLEPRKDLAKDLCPSDCSGHGRCKNRTCICDKGFTALDCSMEVQAVPELLGIYNGGLCDIRERPCRKANLLGQKFIDSNNLTCHVKEFKVFSSSWSPRGVPFTTHGKMNDIFGVKCDLPEPPTRLGDYDHEGTPAAGILVSVSNDGFRTSAQQLRQLTYDSKCMTCTKSGKCQRKPNSCLIRGHCFAANEPNPRDWCQQCLPRDDQNSWTRRKNNQAPTFSRKPITYSALPGEDLVLQLRATDPDNRPVTYSLLSSTATGHTFSPAGLLRWKVTSNEKFTFQVTDECGAFDTTDMRVRIVQCPCLNGGQCVPHPNHPRGSGLYQCKCVNGFSGDRCEKTTGPKPTKSITSKPIPTKPRPTGKPGDKAPDAAPRILHASPVKYDTMRITWAPIPQNKRNGVILGYTIYYHELYANQWNQQRKPWKSARTPNGHMTSITVTGLQSYTEYCVKMSAFTSKGEYPHWKRGQCYQVKTPSLPIKVSGRSLRSTEILLKFEKPRRGPSSTRVQVDYGKQKDRLNMKKACYGSSCVIDNLEADTMYYFKVIGYVYQRGETPSFTQIRTLV
ncbi:von Willebrand factor D and EGF domain-containing protein-like [Actinia tenebrosa]|uniref:von Willebrand factor D and EGF domain-containing protein-like n=1 Tax=Actinia tenebrosa TaxID=6105 RepID=A0A6P8IUZ9_ACTTE|nr:von Willebrand factor D and EGF domain-containing protein-like [Actinia tenebrosa]